jgi:hypothetical protein
VDFICIFVCVCVTHTWIPFTLPVSSSPTPPTNFSPGSCHFSLRSSYCPCNHRHCHHHHFRSRSQASWLLNHFTTSLMCPSHHEVTLPTLSSLFQPLQALWIYSINSGCFSLCWAYLEPSRHLWRPGVEAWKGLEASTAYDKLAWPEQCDVSWVSPV